MLLTRGRAAQSCCLCSMGMLTACLGLGAAGCLGLTQGWEQLPALCTARMKFALCKKNDSNMQTRLQEKSSWVQLLPGYPLGFFSLELPLCTARASGALSQQLLALKMPIIKGARAHCRPPWHAWLTLFMATDGRGMLTACFGQR